MATTTAMCYRSWVLEVFVTRLNSFWRFQLWGQISLKSVRGSFSRLVALSTKLTTENRNMKWKPEPEVVFGAILAKTNNFWVYLGPISPLLWGLRGRYFGPYLTFGDQIFGENFKVVAQGHHTFVRWAVSAFWRFCPTSGRPPAPSLTPGPKIFVALYTTFYSLRTCKVWIFWLVQFWRYESTNIEFCTVAVPTSGMSKHSKSKVS